MDFITSAILGVQGFFLLGAIVILIWLIFRRIRLKKEEDFEKRDN